MRFLKVIWLMIKNIITGKKPEEEIYKSLEGIIAGATFYRRRDPRQYLRTSKKDIQRLRAILEDFDKKFEFLMPTEKVSLKDLRNIRNEVEKLLERWVQDSERYQKDPGYADILSDEMYYRFPPSNHYGVF